MKRGPDTIEDTHPLKGMTGFTLAKVCKAHRSSVGELLSEIGLHAGQEMVLVELWEEDGRRAGELAGRLGVEPPTITKMLRRLEACGLIKRRPDPEDARSFRVCLTRRGRSLETSVTRCWESAEKRALDGLDKEERREFARLLGKVRANLDPSFRVS